MRTSTAAVIVMACLAATAPALGAQARQPSGVKVGDRVRISTRGVPDRRLAEVRALVGDSIEVRYAGGFGEARLPWQEVTALDVNLGRRTAWEGARRGAKRGFFTGLVIGGTVATAALLACGDNECLGYDQLALLAVPVVVAGTTGFGAAIGAVAPGDAWRKVVVP